MSFGLSPCCNAVLWTKPYNGTFECFECGIEYRIVDDNYTLEEVKPKNGFYVHNPYHPDNRGKCKFRDE